MAEQDKAMENAVRAGWDPAAGDPPFEHGTFVEGLGAAERLEDLPDLPVEGSA